MAIIYTYPIKQKPVAADLVVITDSEDKNFTKQCSIQSIIELFDCDLCTFCTTSISKITTPSGDALESITCGEEISFTSSDTSVSITGDNLTKTIDFKVATTPPVDPCPKTYVVKPVECEGGDCVIVDKQEQWFYSNDCFFETYAPGYIKDFKVNGSAYGPEGPSGESPYDCYYVEEAVFTATTSNCPTCCPDPDLIVKLTPCDDGSTIETLATNITDWEPAFLDNPCVFLNITVGGEPLTCYQAEVGTVDSGIAVTINSAQTQPEPCSCDCCLYPCSFTLEPCPGDRPAAFDPIIGSVVQPNAFDPAEGCPYSTGDLVAITFEGETWCFTLNKVCVAQDFDVDMNDTPKDCEDEACSGSEPVIRYKWTNCVDEEAYFTEDVDPGVAIGTIRRYCCPATEDEDICYVYAGEDSSSPAVAPPCESAITDEPDCSCCANPCNYQYTKCPGESPEGFNENIIVDVGRDEKESCQCSEAPPSIYITNESGETWCYNAPEKTCDPATNVLAGLADCGDAEICPDTPALTRRYRPCGAETWLGEDPGSPIPLPPLVEGKIYAGSLSDAPCVVPACCVEIELTETPAPPFPWNVFLIGNGCNEGITILSEEEDCDCCTYHDVATYTRCSEECFIEGFPEVNIDVCAWGKSLGVPQDWKPNTAPNIIKIAISGDIECCYEKTDESPCAAETLISGAVLAYTDLSTDESWDSCAICEEPAERFEFRTCDEEEWSPTTSNLIGFAPSPGTVYTWGKDGECYEIRQGDLEGGEPLDLTGFTNYTESEEEPCQCCKNYKVIEYTQCSLPSPAAGCASLLPTINLVNPNYPGAAPNNVLATDGVNSCCYQIVGDTCNNPSEGYSIVEGVELESCDDEICSAPVELKFAYKKCLDATGGTCSEMLDDVVIQAPEVDLVDFAVITNGTDTCCYQKQAASDADPTEGHSITASFDNCETLPKECIPDDPIERWLYVKCVEADSCVEGIAEEVVIEGPASTLSNFLILQETGTENRCCYVKETESELPVSDYTIFGELGGCDEGSLIEAGCKTA